MVDTPGQFPNSNEAGAVNRGQSRMVTTSLDVPAQFPNSDQAAATRNGVSRFVTDNIDNLNQFPNSAMVQSTKTTAQSQFVAGTGADKPNNFPGSDEVAAINTAQSRFITKLLDTAALFPNSKMAGAVRVGQSRLVAPGSLTPVGGQSDPIPYFF
jgi:hypothetical protein